MQDIEEIYVKYAKLVYKYVFCLTRNEDISEEIVQETFLVAVKDINKFKGECKITTWLCQIAKNIWYRKLKKEKYKEKIPLENIKETIFLDDSIEENLCQKEEKLVLLKRIQKLDENTRNVMYLRILGNLEYEEIGQIMNKTANWARVTFFRGKQKIKEENKNEERM